MRERESEILGKELLDVGALDVVGLFDFDNFENLSNQSISSDNCVIRVKSLAYVN